MHTITIVPEALFETDHEGGGKMHYISCMLCSEHAYTIVIALAVLHWQDISSCSMNSDAFFHTYLAHPDHGSTGTTASLHADDPRRSATARNERGQWWSMPSRSLGVDQRAPTLVAWGMWRAHMADFLRHEQRDLTLLVRCLCAACRGKVPAGRPTTQHACS